MSRDDSTGFRASGKSRVSFWAVAAVTIGLGSLAVARLPARPSEPLAAQSPGTPSPAADTGAQQPPLPGDMDATAASTMKAQFDLERTSGRTVVPGWADNGPGAWVETAALRAAGDKGQQLALPAYGTATSAEPVGMFTDAGLVEMAAFNSPGFDVEQLILQRFGEERLSRYRARHRHW